MHPALSLPEIVEVIVRMTRLRKRTLLCVNRMFSEAALDHIWTNPPVMSPVKCLPKESYYLQYHCLVCPEQSHAFG
jgi:hypothetical protein